MVKRTLRSRKRNSKSRRTRKRRSGVRILRIKRTRNRRPRIKKTRTRRNRNRINTKKISYRKRKLKGGAEGEYSPPDPARIAELQEKTRSKKLDPNKELRRLEKTLAEKTGSLAPDDPAAQQAREDLEEVHRKLGVGKGEGSPRMGGVLLDPEWGGVWWRQRRQEWGWDRVEGDPGPRQEATSWGFNSDLQEEYDNDKTIMESGRDNLKDFTSPVYVMYDNKELWRRMWMSVAMSSEDLPTLQLYDNNGNMMNSTPLRTKSESKGSGTVGLVVNWKQVATITKPKKPREVPGDHEMIKMIIDQAILSPRAQVAGAEYFESSVGRSASSRWVNKPDLFRDKTPKQLREFLTILKDADLSVVEGGNRPQKGRHWESVMQRFNFLIETQADRQLTVRIHDGDNMGVKKYTLMMNTLDDMESWKNCFRQMGCGFSEGYPYDKANWEMYRALPGEGGGKDELYTPEDNKRISTALSEGASDVRLNISSERQGREEVIQLQIQFGADAGTFKRGGKLRNGSKTGIAQINLANKNTRVVDYTRISTEGYTTPPITTGRDPESLKPKQEEPESELTMSVADWLTSHNASAFASSFAKEGVDTLEDLKELVENEGDLKYLGVEEETERARLWAAMQVVKTQ